MHRHTHRIVRGTLVAVGRPDGRLSALTTAEASVCLSVNQASSIQSLGGSAETITVGHNGFKLPLVSARNMLSDVENAVASFCAASHLLFRPRTPYFSNGSALIFSASACW